jgi:poly(3-hydroxybutyrate) depolymerase
MMLPMSTPWLNSRWVTCNTFTERPPIRTTDEQSAYRQQGRAPVALYTIRGGGHTIPGGNVEVMHCYR